MDSESPPPSPPTSDDELIVVPDHSTPVRQSSSPAKLFTADDEDDFDAIPTRNNHSEDSQDSQDSQNAIRQQPPKRLTAAERLAEKMKNKKFSSMELAANLNQELDDEEEMLFRKKPKREYSLDSLDDRRGRSKRNSQPIRTHQQPIQSQFSPVGKETNNGSADHENDLSDDFSDDYDQHQYQEYDYFADEDMESNPDQDYQSLDDDQLSFYSSGRASWNTTGSTPKNYGEHLYLQGLAYKESKERRIKDSEEKQKKLDMEHSFSPNISLSKESCPHVDQQTAEERAKRAKERTQQSLEKWRKEREEAELKELTFKPAINNHRLPADRSTDFVQRMQEMQKLSEERKKALSLSVKKERSGVYTGKPKIHSYSASMKTSESVFDRLSKSAQQKTEKEKLQKEREQLLMGPQLKVKQEGKVNESAARLYESAMKQKARKDEMLQEEEQRLKNLSKTKKFNDLSEQLAIQRKQKLIIKAINDQGCDLQGTMDKKTMETIFSELGVISTAAVKHRKIRKSKTSYSSNSPVPSSSSPNKEQIKEHNTTTTTTSSSSAGSSNANTPDAGSPSGSHYAESVSSVSSQDTDSSLIKETGVVSEENKRRNKAIALQRALIKGLWKELSDEDTQEVQVQHIISLLNMVVEQEASNRSKTKTNGNITDDTISTDDELEHYPGLEGLEYEQKQRLEQYAVAFYKEWKSNRFQPLTKPKMKQDAPDPVTQEHTFHPKLNPRSLEIMENDMIHAESGTIESTLVNRQRVKDAQFEEKKQEILAKMYAENTFKPTLVSNFEVELEGNVIDRLSKPRAEIKKQDKHKTAKEIDDELNMSFKPKLISKQFKRSSKSNANIPKPKGFDKSVSRLKKAQKKRKAERVHNQYGLDLGPKMDFSMDSHSKFLDIGKKTKGRSDNIPSSSLLATSAKEEKKRKRELIRKLKENPPLFYMDVDIGQGKLGRVRMHEGDEAEVVAHNFVSVHSLPGSALSVLSDALQMQYDESMKEILQQRKMQEEIDRLRTELEEQKQINNNNANQIGTGSTKKPRKKPQKKQEKEQSPQKQQQQPSQSPRESVQTTQEQETPKQGEQVNSTPPATNKQSPIKQQEQSTPKNSIQSLLDELTDSDDDDLHDILSPYPTSSGGKRTQTSTSNQSPKSQGRNPAQQVNPAGSHLDRRPAGVGNDDRKQKNKTPDDFGLVVDFDGFGDTDDDDDLDSLNSEDMNDYLNDLLA